jgi:hypothetical protein
MIIAERDIPIGNVSSRISMAIQCYKKPSRRSPFGDGFYTVGLPIYQYTDNLDHYRQHAISMNESLYNPLRDLYEEVRYALTSILNVDAIYCGNMAIPGFHVFDGCRVGNGLWHFDTQFLQFFSQEPSPETTISFTLYLSEDTDCPNIEFSDFHFLDVNRQVLETDYERICRGRVIKVRYKKNRLFVHTGLHAHRIINADMVAPGQARVTLQGFGFLCNNTWHLYW